MKLSKNVMAATLESKWIKKSNQRLANNIINNSNTKPQRLDFSGQLRCFLQPAISCLPARTGTIKNVWSAPYLQAWTDFQKSFASMYPACLWAVFPLWPWWEPHAIVLIKLPVTRDCFFSQAAMSWGKRFCHLFLAHKTEYEFYQLNGWTCVGIRLVIPAGCQHFPANSHYLVGQGDKDHMVVMADL